MPFLALKDRGNRLSINFLIDFFTFRINTSSFTLLSVSIWTPLMPTVISSS